MNFVSDDKTYIFETKPEIKYVQYFNFQSKNICVTSILDRKALFSNN